MTNEFATSDPPGNVGCKMNSNESEATPVAPDYRRPRQPTIARWPLIALSGTFGILQVVTQIGYVKLVNDPPLPAFFTSPLGGQLLVSMTYLPAAFSFVFALTRLLNRRLQPLGRHGWTICVILVILSFLWLAWALTFIVILSLLLN